MAPKQKPLALDAADRGKVAQPMRAPTDAPEAERGLGPPVAPRTVDEKAIDQLPPPIWRRRYQFMKWTLFFCGANVQAIIVYSVVYGVKENSILVQLGLSLIFAGAGIIGAYVFGATWDDKSMRDAIANIRTGNRTSVPGSFSKWER